MTVEKVTDTTDELFEMVNLLKRLFNMEIDIGVDTPSVDKGLKEAEQFFRSFQYKKAFEQAASAIEKVDPKVLKKIETLL